MAIITDLYKRGTKTRADLVFYLVPDAGEDESRQPSSTKAGER